VPLPGLVPYGPLIGQRVIEGDDLKLTLWYHDPDRLRSALCFGGRAEWKPKYHRP
jgi:hypothetical protein